MTRVEGLLFAALLLGGAGFCQPVDYDNTKSRYLLLSAIVDEGRLDIDSHQQYTIDKAVFGGHYYSVKAMGLPLLSAPVYWLLRSTVLGPASLLPDATILADPLAKYLVRVAAVSIPFAFLGIVMLRLLLAMGVSPRRAVWSVLAYGFGTIALNHGSLFSGHQTAAFFLFTSFAVIYHLSRKGASAEGRSTALGGLAGLCAGFAVLCEYATLVSALILAWYAFTSRVPARSKAAFAAGAGLCACALAAYNNACFGSFWTMGYSGFAYAPLREGTAHGLFGISWPRLDFLLGELGSPARGLFFVSPVLLFALPGFSTLWRKPGARREFWTLCLIPAATIILYAGYFGWHGGWGFGPRYLVPALPFLALPMALCDDGGPWFLLAFVLSAFQVACAQLGWPHAAPEIRNPIVEFFIPLLKMGGGSLNLLGMFKPGAIWGGLLQYLILALLAALALRRLPRPRQARLTWPWRALIGAWSAYVMLALLLVRTSDRAAVHRYRGIVLQDAAAALGARELEDAARRELAQGGP